MRKIRWIINLTRILVAASTSSWVARYLFTETVYMTIAAHLGLEGNNFKTYIIISATLSSAVVAAMTLLMIPLFGNSLDARSSWAILFSGIIITTTTPSYRLLTLPSVISGLLLVALGFYFIIAGGDAANATTETTDTKCTPRADRCV